MKNAEWMVKQGKNIADLICKVNLVTDKFEICLDSKIMGEIGIDTISKNPVLVWLDSEHKEPILDDAERRYLSAVIKPFRNGVKYIKKHRGTINSGTDYDSITVVVDAKIAKKEVTTFWLTLPGFKAGAMYKGMEPEKHYTLEELGL